MMNGGEIKKQFERGLYALLSLAVSGVVTMAYLWSVDVRRSIDDSRVMIVEVHKTIATVQIQHGRMEERLNGIERSLKVYERLWGVKHGRDEDER
jgi:hypothetical protein